MNMSLMLVYYTDFDELQCSMEVPEDVVQPVQVHLECIEVTRVQQGMDSVDVVEEELVDDVDELCSRVALVEGDAAVDPVGGGEDGSA